MTVKEIGYKITTDHTFLDKQNAINQQLSNKLEYYHKLAVAGKETSIPKILAAIDRYPKNPQLKNYLSVLYGNIGDYNKMYETNKWLIAEHPDYLFGKLNLANEYYIKQEYNKIPEVLGQEMELKALYPERDTFHISEVISFLKIAVYYFVAIEDIEQVEVRINIMEELAPDSQDTIDLRLALLQLSIKKGQKRYKEEQKTKISIKTKKQERIIGGVEQL
jgi:hypothetical protein